MVVTQVLNQTKGFYLKEKWALIGYHFSLKTAKSFSKFNSCPNVS